MWSAFVGGYHLARYCEGLSSLHGSKHVLDISPRVSRLLLLPKVSYRESQRRVAVCGGSSLKEIACFQSCDRWHSDYRSHKMSPALTSDLQELLMWSRTVANNKIVRPSRVDVKEPGVSAVPVWLLPRSYILLSDRQWPESEWAGTTVWFGLGTDLCGHLLSTLDLI